MAEIDLFSDFKHYHDTKHLAEWRDVDNHADILNVVYLGGTYGNFLKFFIDKFSKQTPDIAEDPFTDNGTSHNRVNWSNKIQKYHPPFILENMEQSNLPVCQIVFEDKYDLLLFKRSRWYRILDRKIETDHLWKLPYGEMPEYLQQCADSIKNLYEINLAYFSWIPKFIVRDWYKLEFLQDLTRTHDYQFVQQFNNHEFFGRQNTFKFQLRSFYRWTTFIENIKKLDQHFQLDLDFAKEKEMKMLFDKGLELDTIRKDVILCQDVLDSQADHKLAGLDVATQAFIYAEFEKRFPDIAMPLTNRFFRDLTEIQQYLDHYPNWYRRKNPNLP